MQIWNDFKIIFFNYQELHFDLPPELSPATTLVPEPLPVDADMGRQGVVFELVFFFQNLSISSLAVVPKGTALKIKPKGLND